jgi:hypothetical protein
MLAGMFIHVDDCNLMNSWIGCRSAYIGYVGHVIIC